MPGSLSILALFTNYFFSSLSVSLFFYLVLSMPFLKICWCLDIFFFWTTCICMHVCSDEHTCGCIWVFFSILFILFLRHLLSMNSTTRLSCLISEVQGFICLHLGSIGIISMYHFNMFFFPLFCFCFYLGSV